MLCLGILGISSAGVLITELRSVPALTVTGWRMVYGAALLAPLALRRPRGLRQALGRHPLSFLISTFLLAVHFGCFTASLYHNDVARTVLLYSTQPLFVVLGAWWFERERPRRRDWAWTLLAVIGALAVAGSDELDGNLTGDLQALGAGISFAGYVLLGRHLRRDVDLAHYTAPLYALTGLSLLACSFAAGNPILVADGGQQLQLLALAVLPTLGGHAALAWALRYLPSRIVSVAYLAEVPGASLLAWLFLAQTLGGTTAAGGTLVLAGVAGLLWSEGSRSKAISAAGPSGHS